MFRRITGICFLFVWLAGGVLLSGFWRETPGKRIKVRSDGEPRMFGALRFDMDKVRQLGERAGGFADLLYALDMPEGVKKHLLQKAEEMERDLAEAPPVDDGSLETAYLVPPTPPRKGTGTLMAGAARITINPERIGLSKRPDPEPFWWRGGNDLTAIPGYGHFNPHVFQVIAKLLRMDNYYSHIMLPSEGTLDPAYDLEATAVVIQDPAGNKVCIVGSDTVGMIGHVLDDVIAALWQRGLTDFTRENLLMSGTHTHTGPGSIAKLYLWWLATVDVFVPEVYEAMIDQFATLIETANSNLQPARIGVGSGFPHEPLTHNRRNQPAYPPDPEPDQEIGVIRIDDLSGNPIAVVFNFAMHGTSVGSIMNYTPGNWGFARKTVENLLGNGVVGIPVNSAEGNVAPNGFGGSNRIEDAMILGEKLGTRVVEIYEATPTTGDIALATAHCQSDDPDPRSPSFRQPCPRSFDKTQIRVGFFVEFEDGTSLPGRVAIHLDDIKHPNLLEREGTDFLGIRITEDGFKNTVIVTFPGEGITEIGMDVKETLKGPDYGFDHAFVFGLANGHISYICDREEYWEGGYEAGSTFFGETTGEVLRDNAVYVGGLLAP